MVTVTETIHPFSADSFFAAQGLAEASFKRFHEGIVADGSADDFTFSQRRIFFIPIVLIEKLREIVHPTSRDSVTVTVTP